MEPLDSGSITERMVENFIKYKSRNIGNLPSRTNDINQKQLSFLLGKCPSSPGVYFMSVGDYFRIGFTSNMSKRLNTLKISNPQEVKLEYFFETTDREQAKRLFRIFHNIFELKEIKQEWYQLTTEDLNFIKAYQNKIGQTAIAETNPKEFVELRHNFVMKSLITFSKEHGARRFTLSEFMEEARKQGISLTSARDSLTKLNEEHKILFLGEIISLKNI